MTDRNIDAASQDLLIINRTEKLSSFRGVLMSTDQVRQKLYPLLKQSKAKLLVDTEKTLMYRITD